MRLGNIMMMGLSKSQDDDIMMMCLSKSPDEHFCTKPCEKGIAPSRVSFNTASSDALFTRLGATPLSPWEIRPNLRFPNEDFGRPNKRFGPCFQSTFKWSVAQMKNSRM
jgi:hypothetical protein